LTDGNVGTAADEPIQPAAPPPAREGEYRSKSWLKIAVEVVLISAGVFLGLMGEQWREDSQRRELAEGALRRFRTEIAANRAAVAAVSTFHVDTLREIKAFLDADAKAREKISLRFGGYRPAGFESSAWDLALATQSLADLDPDLAFALSRPYSLQQGYGALTAALIQAFYVRPPRENQEAFLQAIEVYLGDIIEFEMRLLAMYDDLVPRIDQALAGTAGSATETK
jgi:hypothetical protein